MNTINWRLVRYLRGHDVELPPRCLLHRSNLGLCLILVASLICLVACTPNIAPAREDNPRHNNGGVIGLDSKPSSSGVALTPTSVPTAAPPAAGQGPGSTSMFWTIVSSLVTILGDFMLVIGGILATIVGAVVGVTIQARLSRQRDTEQRQNVLTALRDEAAYNLQTLSEFWQNSTRVTISRDPAVAAAEDLLDRNCQRLAELPPPYWRHITWHSQELVLATSLQDEEKRTALYALHTKIEAISAIQSKMLDVLVREEELREQGAGPLLFHQSRARKRELWRAYDKYVDELQRRSNPLDPPPALSPQAPPEPTSGAATTLSSASNETEPDSPGG